MLGLSYFTMLCNDAEYKNMDQDESLGQLYDVQIWIKIFYKQTRLGLLIFYNIIIISGFVPIAELSAKWEKAEKSSPAKSPGVNFINPFLT